MAKNTTKKGLGLGIEGLLGGVSLDLPETKSEPERPNTLPLRRVEPRPGQPRTRFDETGLAELADSIARYGVLQPVTVRPLEDGYYQIVAGERRWRAARMAGLEEIPVIVVEADERRASELALVENLQREDLNPIEEARGFRTLMQEFGMTQEQAAESVGKSRPAVANALRLLSLDGEVLAMIEQGTLSAGHGRAILTCPTPELQRGLAARAAEQGLSVRQTEQLAARLTKKPPRPDAQAGTDEPPVPQVDYYKLAADRLGQSMGRRVKITEGRRTGKIELEFYGADDREALLQALETVGKLKRR